MTRVTGEHGHYCPTCDETRPCLVAERDGWCLFQPTDAITCERCQWKERERAGEAEQTEMALGGTG